MIFDDRTQAGELLGQQLKAERLNDPVVFGLARGGVVTAAAVAKILKTPLDVIIVRKLAAPFDPEFGFGAIAPLGIRIIDKETRALLGLSDMELEEIINREEAVLERRLNSYRDRSDFPNLSHKTAIIVDDGVATGVSLKAAIAFVKKLEAAKIIAAAPVCALDSVIEIERTGTHVICLDKPKNFLAVGEFYHSFEQVTDIEVIKTLKEFK